MIRTWTTCSHTIRLAGIAQPHWATRQFVSSSVTIFSIYSTTSLHFPTILFDQVSCRPAAAWPETSWTRTSQEGCWPFSALPAWMFLRWCFCFLPSSCMHHMPTCPHSSLTWSRVSTFWIRLDMRRPANLCHRCRSKRKHRGEVPRDSCRLHHCERALGCGHLW